MSEEKPTEERRREARVEKLQLVQVTRFDEEGFYADLATGRTLNISRGGLRLELDHPLPLRSVVNLSLVLEDQILEVSGKVVYLEAIDDERSAMGIVFSQLDPDQLEVLDRYVEE